MDSRRGQYRGYLSKNLMGPTFEKHAKMLCGDDEYMANEALEGESVGDGAVAHKGSSTSDECGNQGHEGAAMGKDGHNDMPELTGKPGATRQDADKDATQDGYNTEPKMGTEKEILTKTQTKTVTNKKGLAGED